MKPCNAHMVLAVVVSVVVATASPVEKVVTLLTELKERITKDGLSEQQLYDKYSCWCEKTSDRKASAIEDAKNSLRSLGQDVLSLKGKIATLAAEVQKLLTDIKANEEAQAQATEIRKKENAAYMAESAEMKQALSALERAIFVLHDATTANALFVQRDSSTTGAAGQLRAVMAALPTSATLPAVKLMSLRRAAEAFASGNKALYAPQSATVQGILKELYATFSTDLESKTSSESMSNRDYEAWIGIKQSELVEMQSILSKKEAEKSEAEVMLSETLQSYDDTSSQLKTDIQFFDSMKEACSAKSAEWKLRSDMRSEELKGIAQALEILTSDEARQLFDKSFKPGYATMLLQTSSSGTEKDLPRKAYDSLKSHASSTHSLRLARLAARVRLAKTGHFDEVIAAIDKMVQTLKDEDLADIAKRDQCKDEYQSINRTIADVNWKIDVNIAKIEKLDALIEEKKEEKERTIADIADVVALMETMTTERKIENEAFLNAKKEDLDAVDLLTQAKVALAEYLEKHAPALLQQGPNFEVSADQAPDATFSDKSARKGESTGIISILTVLIEDLQGEIEASTKQEESAQVAFEKALAAAQATKEALDTRKVNLETFIADRESDRIKENADKLLNEENRTSTESYQNKIKPDCDWIVGAFEKRANKRNAEMDGLVEAKQFLAGYQATLAGEFVQRDARRLRVHTAFNL